MSSKSDEEFQKQLAIGTAGEDKVHPWLKRNNEYVMDLRLQKHTNNRGPRLQGTQGPVILPDFVVWNYINPEKGRFAADVKVKGNPFPVKGKVGRYFGVDDYKLDDYQKCVEIMNLDCVKLIFLYNNKFYVYTDSDALPERHYFGNTFGEYSYLFLFNESKMQE